MENTNTERIVQLFFTYNDVEYMFDMDTICYKYGDTWLPWFEVPVSITNYSNNYDAIKTICTISVQSYLEGLKKGKDDTRREIREFLGIYN